MTSLKVGNIVIFNPKSFFAKRGGKLRAKVVAIEEGLSVDHLGKIDIKCLPGTDCHLTPGESESFSYFCWHDLLEIDDAVNDNR